MHDIILLVIKVKRVLLILIITLTFIPNAKADLTEQQEKDIGEFTTNFVNCGSQRIGSDGFPLLAYMQGQARIDGYQSKLYMVKRDYSSVNVVNAYKWTFDCASFASFIYYKAFNLVLTNSFLNKVDPYSGLKLRSETANPYTVSAFFNDASNNEHFYFVKKNIAVKNIDYSELKKGDLIIIKGSHIMVYIGDGKIAQASDSAISKTNLGFEIASLNELFGTRNVYVIRIKDKVIRPDIDCASEILFPDTNQMVKLVSKNIVTEKKYPTIKYNLSTNEWTKSLTLKIELLDEIGLKSYTFNDVTYNIGGKNVFLNEEIKNNGTFVIKTMNLDNNVKREEIVIKNIDNISPIIENVQLIEDEKQKKIVVQAADNESGLNSNSYSFDGGATWTYNTYIINEYKLYEILVKDNAGNVSKKTFDLTSNKPEIEPKIDDIVFVEEQDKTKKVIITVSECNNCKIAVTNSFKIPSERVNLINNQYTIYLVQGNYYVWLDYNGKIVDNKSFTVSFESQNNIILYATIVSIIISLIVFLIIRLNKKSYNLR